MARAIRGCNYSQTQTQLDLAPIDCALISLRNLGISSGMHHGWTPAMYAANNGHYSVLKALVERGHSINIQDPTTGKTALMLAASNGHTRCVDILISAGADLNIVDLEGKNAAHHAIANGHGNNHLMAKYLQLTHCRSHSAKPTFHVSHGRRTYRPK